MSKRNNPVVGGPIFQFKNVFFQHKIPPKDWYIYLNEFLLFNKMSGATHRNPYLGSYNTFNFRLISHQNTGLDPLAPIINVKLNLFSKS